MQKDRKGKQKTMEIFTGKGLGTHRKLNQNKQGQM